MVHPSGVFWILYTLLGSARATGRMTQIQIFIRDFVEITNAFNDTQHNSTLIPEGFNMISPGWKPGVVTMKIETLEGFNEMSCVTYLRDARCVQRIRGIPDYIHSTYPGVLFNPFRVLNARTR